MVLGYGSTGQGSLAIALQQYVHVAGYGKQCTWSVWDTEWKDLGVDATPLKRTFASCWALATPTLSNEGASVTVVIHELNTR